MIKRLREIVNEKERKDHKFPTMLNDMIKVS